MYKVMTVWVEEGGLFLLADLRVFSSSTTSFDSARWRVTIVLDMHCFSKMVDSKESSTSRFDLFDLAMMMWKMAVVTSWGKVADFFTFHYTVEHYT